MPSICLSFLLRFKWKIFTPSWGLESTADEEQHTMPARRSWLECEWGQQRLRCEWPTATSSTMKLQNGRMACQSAPAKAFLIHILASARAVSSSTLCTTGFTHLHETRTSADKRYSSEQNRAFISGGKKPCWDAWKRRTGSDRRQKQRRAMWEKCQY